MTINRCGHTHNVEGTPNLGPTCCWRPVYENGERCIWHTNEQVAREEYDRHGPVAGRRLDGALFERAPLSDVDWLAGCVLVGADFTEATLDQADLSGADLRDASLWNVSAEGASFNGANLRDALCRYSDFRGASFKSTKLNGADITGVRIDQESYFDETTVAEIEAVEQAPAHDERVDYTAATWLYRELERLYEENAMPERARGYYQREMDLRRRMAWHNGEYNRAVYLEASRWIMRYGTSPWRVLGTSAMLIVLCALIYPLTGGIREVAGETAITYEIADPAAAPNRYILQVVFKSLYFSVVTFSSLGYGDIQPVGTAARAVASVETLIGTLLMALLIFVLTRRFQ